MEELKKRGINSPPDAQARTQADLQLVTRYPHCLSTCAPPREIQHSPTARTQARARSRCYEYKNALPHLQSARNPLGSEKAPPSPRNPFDVQRDAERALTEGQLARSRALQSEGLEGLIPRARALLTLGTTFFLSFGPLIAAVIVFTGGIFVFFGDAFVHGGRPGDRACGARSLSCHPLSVFHQHCAPGCSWMPPRRQLGPAALLSARRLRDAGLRGSVRPPQRAHV